MSKYTAIDVSNYFLYKAQAEGKELLSNPKLQEMVCYAQGLHLEIHGEPLFEDNIEERDEGRVVPKLYELYKEFGEDGIPADDTFDPSIMDDDTADLLDEVYKLFSQSSALRAMELFMTTQVGNKIVWGM
jgi:uncharacterized phage-associated protein